MKFLNLSSFLFLLVGLSIVACHEPADKQFIKDYYFPIDQLKEGLVYEYHPVNNDTLPVEYWYYRTLETDTATYLTATYYDQNYTVRQVSNEEIVSNGSILYNHFLYEFDTTGLQYQIPAVITSSNAFPFEVRDSGGVFILKLRWVYQQDPEISMTLIRNRQYAGRTSYSFKEQEMECVVFDLKEVIDHSDGGHLEVAPYNGTEYYAKDLGLIYYKKEISDNFIMEYELVDTFSMKVLEERYRGTIGFNQ